MTRFWLLRQPSPHLLSLCHTKRTGEIRVLFRRLQRKPMKALRPEIGHWRPLDDFFEVDSALLRIATALASILILIRFRTTERSTSAELLVFTPQTAHAIIFSSYHSWNGGSTDSTFANANISCRYLAKPPRVHQLTQRLNESMKKGSLSGIEKVYRVQNLGEQRCAAYGR